MAHSIDDLNGHMVEVLREKREFTDPWGLGISGVITRGDNIAWTRYLLKLNQDSEDFKKIRLATAESFVADVAPDGFRAGKKLSKAEAHRRMVVKIAEPSEPVVTLEAIRDQKPGIAEHLLLSLTYKGETRPVIKGETFDLTTPSGRAAFMDHELWCFEEDGESLEFAVPLNAREPDENGDPVENFAGGMNFGDAVAKLSIREANDQASFVWKRKAKLVEPSAGTATGTTGSGSENQSLSEGQ